MLGLPYQQLAIGLTIALVFSACNKPSSPATPPQTAAPKSIELALNGRIFGTTWAAKLRGKGLDQKGLMKAIKKRLEGIDKGMSTWRKDSELSAFNSAPAGVFTFGEQTTEVIAQSFLVAQMTQGAFDPTVRPLIALWGFGAGARKDLPSTEELAVARAAVGYKKLRWAQARQLVKPQADVSLDLSAIAKGYAVDRLADLLKKGGAEAGMVEIGGEVVAWGERKEGGPWKLAIDSPADGAAPGQRFAAIVALSDAAMATSGDYRQFRIENGKRVQHIVDPRTGNPVDHGLASVTVIAPDCATADAYATALMVLGADEGLKLVDAHADLEALFLLRQAAGFKQVRSRGMSAHLLGIKGD